jgi:PadR family transcriptional regulator PadR
MKRTNLGELEELVLLVVSSLHPEAYGVNVRHEVEQQAGRNITLSTVHVAMHRLEEKGFLKSQFGEATNVRGGKRKRIFKITAFGLRALQETREVREKLWNSIPGVILQKR